MKKTKKKLLGFLGLILVIAMTVIAYSIPSPEADATSSVMETIVVKVYDQYPGITITSPANEEILVGSNHTVTYDWNNATSADFTLTYDGEVVASWHDDYNDFQPSTHPFGSNSHAISLNNYGRYILSAVANGPIGTFEDSIEFYRLSTHIAQIGTEENGDPRFKIDYDEGVKVLRVQVYDENNNPILSEPIIITVPANTTSTNLVIPMPEDSASGTYRVVVEGLDDEQETISDSSFTTFEYEAPISPDTPDTGEFSAKLNIARSDYLITGLLIFFSAAIAALFLLNRKKER